MSPSELLARIESREARLAVIGLGYVGLPLAVEFGKRYDVVGFDIHARRLDELRHAADASARHPEPDADGGAEWNPRGE